MRNWIVLLTVVGVVVMISLGINKLVSNNQEEIFLKHRDMIYGMKKDLNIVKLQDGLVTLGYVTVKPLGMESNTRYSFSDINSSYSQTWLMNDIQDDIIDYYLDYASKCGITDDSFLSCKLEDEEALYKFTQTNDRTIIEIYRYTDIIEYMKLDYTVPEDMIIYYSVITREGNIVSGEYFHYQFQDTIEYHKIVNDEVMRYEKHLILDKYREFLYRYSDANDYSFLNHTATFWDEDKRIAFTFDFIFETDELRNYHIDFYDADHLQLLHLKYEDGELVSISWDDNHLDGWLEFYNDTCLDNILKQTEPYVGLCTKSRYSAPAININDYLGEDLEGLISFETFGLDFTDVTVEDIENAEMYLLSRYQDVYTNNNFDYTNRMVGNFAFFDFISPNVAIITELLGDE